MNNKKPAIYIIDALRTPVGKLHGALSHLRPDDLGATLIQGLCSRNTLDINQINGVVLGCANQAGEDNRNLARMACFLSNLPYSTTATTINSLCSSGMDAIFSAIRSIALGEGDLYLAGGVESMSRSPIVTSKVDGSIEDSLIGWRFINPSIEEKFPTLSMPETAELLAAEFDIDRTEQDLYAYQSRIKYEQAKEKGIWNEEIFPIQDKKGKLWKHDEQHRLLTLDLLSKLPKLLQNGACISSGNAARIGDGAAIVALASEDYVKRNNVQPLAKVNAWANAACHPNYMSLSAVEASKKAFHMANINPSELDWIEMSEAFAIQAIACIKELELNPSIVNPNGGALTIGNPISVGSARLIVSLAKEIGRNKRIKTGMATTCAGLGTGAAIILEQA